MENSIYLDYNSTTPIKPEVIDFMSKTMAGVGNASSIHGFGRSARHHIEDARTKLSEMIKVDTAQIYFTSGTTESNNTILQSFFDQRVLVCASEHPSVLDVLPGVEVIPVVSSGLVDMDALDRLLSKGDAPALVSVMLVNNETGVIQPLGDIARYIRKRHPSVYIHTDAAQAPGKYDIDMMSYQIDFMSLSAHKFGGPQGVGALIAAPGAKFEPLLRGGGQEKRQRSGTENVAGIAAMGFAAELVPDDLAKHTQWKDWQDKVEAAVKSAVPQAVISGATADRVPNTVNIALPGVEAQTQLMSLDLSGIAVSNGSACSSGKVVASHVLKAMGADDDVAGAALRMSLGWATTEDDIDAFVQAWCSMADRLKDKIKGAA